MRIITIYYHEIIELTSRVQVLDEAVCISLCIYVIGKSIYSSFPSLSPSLCLSLSIYLYLSMSKIVRQTRLFSFERANSRVKGKILNLRRIVSVCGTLLPNSSIFSLSKEYHTTSLIVLLLLLHPVKRKEE